MLRSPWLAAWSRVLWAVLLFAVVVLPRAHATAMSGRDRRGGDAVAAGARIQPTLGGRDVPPSLAVMAASMAYILAVT